MTTRKSIEDLNESSGSKKAAALAYLLGYTARGFSQLHMGCSTREASGASATSLFDFLDDNPGAVEALIEWVLNEGCDSDGEELTDEDQCECGEDFDKEGLCPECDAEDAEEEEQNEGCEVLTR
jgi:hypothetical protein